MASSMSGKESIWPAGLSRTFIGTSAGALLGGGYGIMVWGVQFLTTGNAERGIGFAGGAVCVGAALGLLAAVALSFLGRDSDSSHRDRPACPSFPSISSLLHFLASRRAAPSAAGRELLPALHFLLCHSPLDHASTSDILFVQRRSEPLTLGRHHDAADRAGC
jgi:hypothetical protein